MLLDRAAEGMSLSVSLPPVDALARTARRRSRIRVALSLTVMILVVAVSLVGLAGVGLASDWPPPGSVTAAGTAPAASVAPATP